MSAETIPRDHARLAYDVFAGFYDDFTADYDHDGWVGKVEGLLRSVGAPGRALLDVACGTGTGFEPLLARGYEVTALDLSPAMVAEARRKAGDRIRVATHDMRALPELGRFDIVWCIGEALNYMQTDAELLAAFAGARRNLREEGVFIFDAIALGGFRSVLSSLAVTPGEDRVLVLDGRGSPTVEAGGTAQARIERLIRGPDGAWRREASVHHHRHHPEAAIRAALARSGFAVEAVRGCVPDEPLQDPADELRHIKLLFAARPVRADVTGR